MITSKNIRILFVQCLAGFLAVTTCQLGSAMEWPHLNRTQAPNRPAVDFSPFLLDSDTWTLRYGSTGERLPANPPPGGNGAACVSTEPGKVKLYVTYKPMLIYTMGRRPLMIDNNFARRLYEFDNQKILKPLMTVPPFTVMAVTTDYCFRSQANNGLIAVRSSSAPVTEMMSVRIISMPSGDLLAAHGKFFTQEMNHQPLQAERHESDGVAEINRYIRSWNTAERMMNNLGFPIASIGWPSRDRTIETGVDNLRRGFGESITSPTSRRTFDVQEVVNSVSATFPRLSQRAVTQPTSTVGDFLWQLQSYFEKRYVHGRLVNKELYGKTVRQNFVDRTLPSQLFLNEIAMSNMFVHKAELDTELNRHVVVESLYEIKSREDLIAHFRAPISRNSTQPRNIVEKLQSLEGTIFFKNFPETPADINRQPEYQRVTTRTPIPQADRIEAIRRSKFFKLLDGPLGANETAYHEILFEDVATFFATGCGHSGTMRHVVPEFLINMITNNSLDIGAPDAGQSIPIESSYFHMRRENPPVEHNVSPERLRTWKSQTTRTCYRGEASMSRSVAARVSRLVRTQGGIGRIPFSGSDKDILDLIRSANHPYARVLKYEVFRNWANSARWSPTFRGSANRYWCAMAVRQPLQRISIMDFQGTLGDAWHYIFSQAPDPNTGYYNSPHPSVETTLQYRVRETGLRAIRAESFFASSYQGLVDQRTGRNRNARTYPFQFPRVFDDGAIIDLLPDMGLHVYTGGNFGHVEYKLRIARNDIYVADYREELPRGLRTEDGTPAGRSELVLASYEYNDEPSTYSEFQELIFSRNERNLGAAFSFIDGDQARANGFPVKTLEDVFLDYSEYGPRNIEAFDERVDAMLSAGGNQLL